LGLFNRKLPSLPFNPFGKNFLPKNFFYPKKIFLTPKTFKKNFLTPFLKTFLKKKKKKTFFFKKNGGGFKKKGFFNPRF